MHSLNCIISVDETDGKRKVAMKGAEVLAVQSLQQHLGDANLKR